MVNQDIITLKRHISVPDHDISLPNHDMSMVNQHIITPKHDISVPVASMAKFVEEASPQVEAKFPGTRAIGFGHLGDGNIHFHVLAPAGATRGAWEADEGKRVSAFVHDLVDEFGGSISAEHGIGQVKRDELDRLGDPVALAMMRSVKQALDPNGLLNPGKLVPLAKDHATA